MAPAPSEASRWGTPSDANAGKATDAQFATSDHSTGATFERMKDKVRHSEAVSQAKAELFKDDVEEQLAVLEKQDQIEKMLADMKAKRG